MDKNLVVSLDEIKGIRLQCKECGSEAVVSPKNNYLYGHTCPQGQRFPLARVAEAVWRFPGNFRLQPCSGARQVPA